MDLHTTLLANYRVQGFKDYYGSLWGNIMRWFGIILALAGLVAALVAWFSFQNLPFLIGGSVCVLIGLIIFGYGTRSLPK